MPDAGSAYLNIPPRTLAEVEADRARRAAIADRAEMYERVLGFDPNRALWVAGRTLSERIDHWFGQWRSGPADGPPMFERERENLARMALHPDVGAAFWHSEHNRLVDLLIVLDELYDEADQDVRRFWNLTMTREGVKLQASNARLLALAMEGESDRRCAGGRAA